MILPPRELFSTTAAGAIALVVERLARATPGALVIGPPLPGESFPGVMFQPVGNGLSILRVIKNCRPGIVEVHQKPRLALLIAKLFPRTRVLLFVHNDPLAMRGLKSTFERRLMLRHVHQVVCVSNYLKSRYMQGLTGPGPAVLHNPLTLAALPPRAAMRKPEILFVGRLVHDKGPDIFIAACALALPQLPGWSARMIGGDRFGPDSPETPYVIAMRDQAAKAGVHLTGPLPHQQALAAMAAADIAVVPSRWAEPFGLTALEALASGAALITTRQGGLPEVAGEAALYVPADDAKALADAMMKLAQNAALRAGLQTAGLAQAQLFDTPLIATALAHLRNAHPAV
ncbi:MAG TPA: glycosyltransferase family 4 protein [Acidocella sp.]|nr:glycosyltransferase family 4 protein [Acidocella sp.]